jgi:CelD/BcsL family acetyltransferase involved in cellulose biosynthesis
MSQPGATPASRWIGGGEGDAWDRELALMPEAMRDVYFEWEYVSLYAAEGTEPGCFVYSEGDCRFFYPFLFQRVRPDGARADLSTAYGYGGPLVASDDPAFAARARAKFRKEAVSRGAIAELIKFHPLLGNEVALPGLLDRVVPVCPVVYADLQIDAQRRWEQVYTHANRKNINKARRANATVHMEGGDAEWAAFRRLYAATMVNNAAADFYHFSDDYFRAIRERLPSHHRLVTVRLEGEIVAAMIVLLGTRFVHCHLIGTDRAAIPFGVNNLLHHELIVWAAAQGYERLLIGGGRGNAEDDTLLRFKRNFSDLLATFHVGETVLDAAGYDAACAGWRDANPGRDVVERLLSYRY